MLRSLGFLIALALVTPSAAHAQVFKPKSSAKKTESKSASKKASKKAAAKKPTPKKRAAAKKKKAPSRSEDQMAEAAPKEADKDFVMITDDEQIE